MSFLCKRGVWSVAAAAVVAITAGGATAAGANSSKPNTTSFNLFPNGAVLNCLAAPGQTPYAQVKVERGKLNDRLELEVKNLKPNLDFDVFTVENSPQVSDGTANPTFNKNFGFAWYQSDLHTNRHGQGEVHLRTILLDQIFGFDAGRGVPPVNTFNLGFWFNNPADAANCGFTGVTPFNGEHNAGALAMISRIDATTKLGRSAPTPSRIATERSTATPDHLIRREGRFGRTGPRFVLSDEFGTAATS